MTVPKEALPDEPARPATAELRVLGMADISGPTYADYWLWCRLHEQAVKVDFKCHDGGWPTRWFPLDGCIRVGPFMSEWEAGRLAGASQRGCTTHLTRPPLGMKVER